MSSDKPVFATIEYSIPRSIRLTDFKPQRWAISVALLDQGEIVPERGTTSHFLPPCQGLLVDYRKRAALLTGGIQLHSNHRQHPQNV